MRIAPCRSRTKSAQRLVAGLSAGFDDERQQIVYELASALVQPRIVSTKLYERAKNGLSDAGLVEVAAARSGYLYYTSTSQQLMLRVVVVGDTLDPAALPEFVAGGRYWDDFVLDEDSQVAYVTTHRENTIDRVVMQSDGN